ncbi:MAG TPA: trypsin-like peptidase domain-containing protein [Planctomycetota bacterium]|nr:trypsin-like peptidase domain-containing protein [Planctomycetota bacterium]
MKQFRVMAVVLMAAALLSGAVRVAAAEDDAAKTLAAARDLEKAYVETIKKALPAYCFFPGGSGVLISADGYVLTNYHVVRDKKRVQVRNAGKSYVAKSVGVDNVGDIALLKLQDASNLAYVDFADSDALKVGQPVIAIGNPFNTADLFERTDDPTVTTGVISAMHRYEANYTDAIQTDAAVNPGNSGGPLLTMDGKLAGINGLIETKLGNAANTGVALAVPANQIKRFLPRLKEANGGPVAHGTIRGLNKALMRRFMVDDGAIETTEGMREGAEVKTVDKGSIAEKVGLAVGDKILKIDDYPLLNNNRFLGVMNTYPAGSEVKLTVDRNGARKTVAVTLQSVLPGKLGVEMIPITGADGNSIPRLLEARIKKVDANSPADRAGLKADDVILSVDGEAFSNLKEFRDYMSDKTLFAGDKLKMKVRRGPKDAAKELDLEATLSVDETKAAAQRRNRFGAN